jgi:hypothetical protein
LFELGLGSRVSDSSKQAVSGRPAGFAGQNLGDVFGLIESAVYGFQEIKGNGNDFRLGVAEKIDKSGFSEIGFDYFSDRMLHSGKIFVFKEMNQISRGLYFVKSGAAEKKSRFREYQAVDDDRTETAAAQEVFFIDRFFEKTMTIQAKLRKNEIQKPFFDIRGIRHSCYH